MDDASADREVIFQSPSRKLCMEAKLVLDSVGIVNQLHAHSDMWQLLVAGDDFRAAATELEAYRRDNEANTRPAAARIRLFGGALTAVFVYAFVIAAFAVVSHSPASHDIWHGIGQMHVAKVLPDGDGDSQWWRVVTALTLHADAGHLFSNLAFGGVFGFLAGRILGGGVAWLTIVIAGSLGNLLNAWMREPDHTSIGASTAVFAALGVMVAHALKPRSSLQETPLQRWRPLIGGVLLLAFLGLSGERTDVGAHVTGFLAGVVLGWLASRLPERWLALHRVQIAAGLVAAGIVIGAWTIAVMHARV